ncbi:hypothetical protein J2850_005033 [Azospirillum picis]|uniref:Uncharacterized protein n=1 Tax=Azospirillum picis TaxID=488438 RepID=A0ABU0MRD2_9PROT|nr:hypothetical protein [Azospirillum picis]MDQ0535879.1 hypothetical protein [Azospirillum picis]
MNPLPWRAGGPANLSQKFKPFLNRTGRERRAGGVNGSTPVCAGGF